MAKLRRAALVVLVAALLAVAWAGCAAAEDVDLTEELTEEEREIMSMGDDDVEELGGSQEPADEKDVVILGGSDFADFVASNPFVMVEFYAPWCGHCQSLTPEYARAATALKPSGVVLAKVDSTQHAELAQEHGIEGYPTLLFFVDGEKRPYNGGRTRLPFPHLHFYFTKCFGYIFTSHFIWCVDECHVLLFEFANTLSLVFHDFSN